MRRQQNRRLITTGILIIAALGLLFAGQRSGILRPLISGLMLPLAPLTGLLSGGADAVLTPDGQTVDYETLLEQNRELQRTVAELQVEIVRLREIEQDYYRLAELTDYLADRPDQSLVSAEVIARDTSSYLRWIVINRGTRDGVRVGYPVINERGLVGRVEEVAANASWVRLAIDPGSAINTRLQDARAEGTVVGQLQGGLRMELIPQSALVENGDLVLTSGLGGTMPPDIVVGQVTSVRSQQAELFQTAEIRPIVNFDQLELVSVITNFNPVDVSLFDDVIAQQSQPAQ